MNPALAEPARVPVPPPSPDQPLSQDKAPSDLGRHDPSSRTPFGGHQADHRTRALRMQARRHRRVGFWLVLAFLLLCVIATLLVLSTVSSLGTPLL
jgi:hypothetical protein